MKTELKIDDFNPDCLISPSELGEWLEYFEQASNAASQLKDFSDERAYEIVDLLWQYCDRKQKSMVARKAGDISLALFHEQACDRIYSTLPDSLKW